MKYPDFNVSATGPKGGYVNGKSGGQFSRPMPTPANDNGNVVPFKYKPDLSQHSLKNG